MSDRINQEQRTPAREAATPPAPDQATPVIRVPLAGVPAKCPHCDEDGPFPLGVHGHRVAAVCPHCHTAVAPIEVTSEPTPAEMIGRAIRLAGDSSDGGNQS